jgi:hypothetical protein
MKEILLTLVCILPIFLAAACGQSTHNAYVVSSDLRAVPIIDNETGQTVGHAYNGFAVSMDEIRNQKAYFHINISDPSPPNITTKTELYIPVEYMKKAYVEPQNVPAIISLDTITTNPMAGISLFRQGVLQVIARFDDEIGPMQFIQNVENGYLFILGMNLVWISEQEVELIKYDD